MSVKSSVNFPPPPNYYDPIFHCDPFPPPADSSADFFPLATPRKTMYFFSYHFLRGSC